MTDLDRYTTAELVRMAADASTRAILHYARAASITQASGSIPYHDRAAYAASQTAWHLAMAAGNEQEDLCRAIGEELRMREVCDA